MPSPSETPGQSDVLKSSVANMRAPCRHRLARVAPNTPKHRAGDRASRFDVTDARNFMPPIPIPFATPA
jgi:hypothetical protein